MKEDVKKKLISLVSYPVQWECGLDRFTSFSIGGPAAAVVRVDLRLELSPLLAFLAEENLPWRIMGRGTNVLVKDEGFAGVIVMLGKEFMTVEKRDDDAAEQASVQAGGGCGLGKLSSCCMDWGLAGMEFTCGIPGTVGGGVIMNAGAWGRDMSSVVESVSLVSGAGEKIFKRDELVFSYRYWKGFERYRGTSVVTDVELRLSYGDPVEIKKQRRLLQDKRKAAQPSLYANAGSFFKNPENDSAGRLIDASGLKGVTFGAAMVSEQHGNFLVNRGGATADEVLTLMKMVQKKVKDDSGIDLEPEIHFF